MMPGKYGKRGLLSAILPVVLMVPAIACAQLVGMEEAKLVAGNWLRFIVERDGNWGGSKDPQIARLQELQSDGLPVGYSASVQPSGTIYVSASKGFAPI